MGSPIGLSVWQRMSAEDRRAHLLKAEKARARRLASLSYEESLRHAVELMELGAWMPPAFQRPLPCKRQGP